MPLWSTAMSWTLAVCCGLLIGNVYYAQPLTALIGSSIGMARERIGLLVTMPLSGYGLGLLFVVPLADRVENRRLVLMLVALEALGAVAMAFIRAPMPFLVAGLCLGIAATAVQVLVPYVTFVAPASESPRAVGRIVIGIMFGIMASRPLSSIVTHASSWRTMFMVAAALMGADFTALWVVLPRRRPVSNLHYGSLLASMASIFVSNGILRRRAFYHACMFGAFSVFWTCAPIWLAAPPWSLSQAGIAWIALAGVGGALAPPFAGRAADRGWTRLGTIAAMLCASAAFVMTWALPARGSVAAVFIAGSALLLDFAVSANYVFGQRAIYALAPEQRGRLNALFMASFFFGGAACSALGAWTFSHFGWAGPAAAGCALPLLALTVLMTDRGRN